MVGRGGSLRVAIPGRGGRGFGAIVGIGLRGRVLWRWGGGSGRGYGGWGWGRGRRQGGGPGGSLGQEVYGGEGGHVVLREAPLDPPAECDFALGVNLDEAPCMLEEGSFGVQG